ncbi:MAG: S-adenosyl-l-methionine hydroxide adenosyltransferase family protein [Solobacterium sp.]|nr:S-adenosyl-l-methionine hydroxide adenosyltransferase family protein [Solobacterium sp.]MBQ1439461.1 S-adenosyl-l-methionine hydroxide adenosyltransferase family protein [Solobacterium sp.]
MNHLLVLQSDFGLSDGAVAAMEGVALSVDPSLRLYSLTHEIPPFDTYEASYRLLQAVPYWPEGSVFVSVVDPGVGSARRSCVAKTVTGQYIVTPDNGSLSHIARVIGIEEVREISKDERRAGSQFTQTFHGRDVYAYIGARLAAGIRKFEEIGEPYDVKDVVMLEMPEAKFEDGVLTGTIETLDVRFGSLWTNISSELFAQLGAERKDLIDISIYNGDRKVHRSFVTYALTFADVEIGESLIYVNSMNHMAVAINQGSFADAYHIGTRNGWKITMKKASGR